MFPPRMGGGGPMGGGAMPPMPPGMGMGMMSPPPRNDLMPMPGQGVDPAAAMAGLFGPFGGGGGMAPPNGLPLGASMPPGGMPPGVSSPILEALLGPAGGGMGMAPPSPEIDLEQLLQLLAMLQAGEGMGQAPPSGLEMGPDSTGAALGLGR